MTLRFSGHARQEMASDRISEADSDTSLRRETSSSNIPMTARGETIIIITTYEPDPDRWDSTFRIRRPRQ